MKEIIKSDADEGYFCNEDYHEEVLFSGIDFSLHDISGHNFEACRFKHSLFNEADLTETVFRDVLFEECQWVMTGVDHATLGDVRFESCKIMGVNFSSCNDFGFSVDYRESVLDSLVFSRQGLRKTLFRDCRIVRTDFSDCDLRDADFNGTRFEEVVFSGCNLEKADFREAAGYEIDPMENRIRRARFRLPEAYSFLGFLGIEIVE